MGYLLKTFLFIFIITVSINIGATEIISEDFHGTPSYTIFSYSDSPVVNQRDNISINVFISGAGDADANKLSVFIPTYIVKNNSVEITLFSYDVTNGRFISPPRITNTASPFSIKLIPDYFTEYPRGYLINKGEIPIMYGKKDFSPLTFSFTVNDQAPAGDHRITYILFYKNGSQWYNSEKSITIHIRYWSEEHPYAYASLVALIGALVVAGASFIWNYIAKRVKRQEECIQSGLPEHFHNWHP